MQKDCLKGAFLAIFCFIKKTSQNREGGPNQPMGEYNP